MASLLFIVLAFRYIRSRLYLASTLALIAAAVIFVVCMEEISWGQRLFDIQSSDFFLSNTLQQETNLHNLNTNLSERLFYLAGFTLLVLLPFFRTSISALFAKFKKMRLADFLPDQWFVLPFSFISGYMSMNLYHDPSMTIILTATLLVLVWFAMHWIDRKNLAKASLYISAIFIVLAMAAVFLLFNYEAASIRSWARKEYLEFFIALGILSWAVSCIWHKNGSQRSSINR